MRAIIAALAIATTTAAAEPTPESLAIALFKEQIPITLSNAVFCLEVDKKDPSSAVFSALRPSKNRLAAASECVREISPAEGSYERKSKRPAMFISVSGFRVTGSNRGEVALELFRHGRWAIYKTLEVEQSDGTWKVVATKSHEEA